jgi:hypothetical protein
VDPESQLKRKRPPGNPVAAILIFTHTRFEGRSQLAHHHRFLFEGVFMLNSIAVNGGRRNPDLLEIGALEPWASARVQGRGLALEDTSLPCVPVFEPLGYLVAGNSREAEMSETVTLSLFRLISTSLDASFGARGTETTTLWPDVKVAINRIGVPVSPEARVATTRKPSSAMV